MTAASQIEMEEKEHPTALRIHISCASSLDRVLVCHPPPPPPPFRNAVKSIVKPNSSSSPPGSIMSPPSPILATNFQTVHPSAKYHPLARHAQKPLSTYTALGTPIPRRVILGGGGRRPRSVSLGSISCLVNNTTICPTNSPNNNNNSNNMYVNNNNNNNNNAEPAPPEVPLPPRLAARRQAEVAERSRAAAMEQEEVQYSADELRMILKKERIRMEHILADLTELRSGGVAQEQLQAEILEEECINGLVRRLDHLHEEKARYVIEEREQEMIANALRKRLEELSRQRRDLEAQIVAEENKIKALQMKIQHTRQDSMEEG